MSWTWQLKSEIHKLFFESKPVQIEKSILSWDDMFAFRTDETKQESNSREKRLL